MSGNLAFKEVMKESSQSIEKGTALQIISIQDEKFILNETNLRNILSKSHKPVIIISIIGSFRTGKSFLINSFLQYLKRSQIPKYSSYTENENEIEENGFNWSYGSSSHTKGIWMWDTPIDYTLNDKEVSLLLMDTQGIFDNDVSQKECSAIFSISAFMSSIQIFNIKNNIEKRDLEYLNIFAQYKKISDKAFNKIFCFKQITFLVRDWQFPDEYSYGFEGGANLLRSRLETCQSDSKSKRELIELLTDLKVYFKNRNCFLMPHPGPAVTKKDFNGNFHELNPEFLNYCHTFFKNTLENISDNSENEIRSSIFRNGENLFNMFKDYIDALKTKTLQNFESIATVYSKHNNLLVRQQELKNYNDSMIEFIKNNVYYIRLEELETYNTETTKKCLDNYKTYAMETVYFGDDFSDIKKTISDMYENLLMNVKKQNKNYIQVMKNTAYNNYLLVLKKFSDDESMYQKPIDLFMQHQNTKISCLKDFETLKEYNHELKKEYTDLCDKMDEFLEMLDKKNAYKKEVITNSIKLACVNKYKCKMNFNWPKDENGFLEPQKFHEMHIHALEECLKEFEIKTINYKDLNSNYEEILSNEIRGLYASYFLTNSKKQPKYPSLMTKFKEMIKPLTYKLKDYRLKQNKTNKKQLTILKSANKCDQETPFYIEIVKLFIYIIMFFIHYILSSCSYIYELISDAEMQYSIVMTFFFHIIDYYFVIFKSIWRQAKSISDT